LRQETRGTERIAPTGTRNGEERAKSPERDHAKRHKEQKQECGATRNEDHAKRHEEGRRSRLEARGREEPAQPVMQRDALEDENSTK